MKVGLEYALNTLITSFPNGKPLPNVAVKPMTLAISVLKVK